MEPDYIDEAKTRYETESIRIDDDAVVSASSNGAWVQAWVWVDRNNWARLDVRRWMDSVTGSYETSDELAKAAVEELQLSESWLDDASHWIHEEAWLSVMGAR
ncbi:MAG: hypothetical protein FJ083_14545 [Cyanobacteria bacterium K_Offshore_surface_m2_239]|nr:hypothetical protein [Cyanobacteria bacterium K_Offshore_surface_m2_239]